MASDTTSTIRSDDGRSWEAQGSVGVQGTRSTWTIDPLHPETHTRGALEGHDEDDLVNGATVWTAVLLFAALAEMFWVPKKRVTREEREPETTE